MAGGVRLKELLLRGGGPRAFRGRVEGVAQVDAEAHLALHLPRALALAFVLHTC